MNMKDVRRVASTASSGEKKSNAEDAYQEILGRLRNGLIGHGDRIVDTALASELAMSRMPAREALLRLVNEGYLVGSTRGFRLPELSRTDILEIFEIRKLLEPRAAAQAAVVLTQGDLEKLEAAHDEAVAASERSDPRGLFTANARFRDAWMEHVPNQRLSTSISRFFDQVNMVRIATLHDDTSRSLSIAMGKKVLEGFRKRDSLEVNEQMLSFIESARQRFIDLAPDIADHSSKSTVE